MERAIFEWIGNDRIFGIFSESKASSNRLLIMHHGFRGSSIGSARSFVDLSRLLIAKGYSTLRVDFPNCGNSSGRLLEASFFEWVRTSCQLARRFIERGFRVGFLGESMGATACMIAAANLNACRKIPCVLMRAPDPVLYTDVEPGKAYEEKGQLYRGQFWIEAKNADFLKAVAAYDGDVLLTYGTDDTVISEAEQNVVVDAVRKRGGEVVKLAHEGHFNWRFHTYDELFKKELQFIEKAFERK